MSDVPDDQPGPSDDDDLLRRSAGGDGRAFGRLVDRHADRLYRLAVSLVGRADAEDVVQEALAGAYRSAGGFRGGASVRTWLSRILATQAAKWWRDRKGRRPEVLDDPVAGGGDGGESAVSSTVGAKLDLHAALDRLSPEHRQVLVLRELDGMSYDEIAAVVGVPRGTVESRLHRARGELRKQLSAYEA